MYEYIKGTVEYVGPHYIVIDNNGIGYRIMTPNPFVFSVDGRELKLYTYHYVREDQESLFGFRSQEEKNLFEKLLDVTGIGPKGALAIIGSGQVGQVVQAIEQEDEKFLVKFPGVGKKTARQMILDLKGKLENIVPDYFPDLFTSEQAVHRLPDHENLEEAMEALKALGYSEREIQKVGKTLEKEHRTTEEYIKMALQLLLK
ncbi:MAG: Holliday junction branch migration protein RuvA [Bacillus sp. (in: firmicutes)]